MSRTMSAYPTPHGGAALILAFRLPSKTVLIIGSNALAAARAVAALEADSTVVVLAKGGVEHACDELKWRAQQQQVTVLDLDSLPSSSSNSPDHDAQALDAYLATVEQKISFVCVTDTIISSDASSRRTRSSAQEIYHVCHKGPTRNIPVNVTDFPELCDFTFTSTHRFMATETGEPSPLQVGVTTNGQGCRLAGRVRREIVSTLPKEIGGAACKIGKLRALAKVHDTAELEDDEGPRELNEENGLSTPNRPVPQRSCRTLESVVEGARRRMKWVAQVSEYWPLPRLANMTDEDMSELLNGDGGNLDKSSPACNSLLPHHALGESKLSAQSSSASGKILLVGSGPGHPSLLTLATYAALTKHASLVLSDKLVPAAVLALIPPEVEVRIARKFPGNAEGAQMEMMEAAVEAARLGRTVVRLKQGDPMVYGRAGEEVLYFRSHGFEPIVVPGVTSALAGPTFAGIPVTQRGVAESFVVCTGVGRAGKEVRLPGYKRERTLLILMGVARLGAVLTALQEEDAGEGKREGARYPPHLPIAIIERASMPDQRVVASTLQNIAAALESVGEQRPPGMIVVGWSVLALWGKGDVSVLDDTPTVEKDEERVKAWLGGDGWKVQEGFDVGWQDLL